MSQLRVGQSNLIKSELGKQPILTCIPLLDWMARGYSLYILSDAQKQSFLRLPGGEHVRHGFAYGAFAEDIPVGTLMAEDHAWMLYSLLKDFLKLIDLESTDSETGIRIFQINDYGRVVAGGIIPKEMVALANKPYGSELEWLKKYFPELHNTKIASMDIGYTPHQKLPQIGTTANQRKSL